MDRARKGKHTDQARIALEADMLLYEARAKIVWLLLSAKAKDAKLHPSAQPPPRDRPRRRVRPGPDLKSRMLTSISLQEGSLLVSGRAERGGPQFSSSKRPTVHLKLAFKLLPRAASSSALSFPGKVGIIQWPAWNVSELLKENPPARRRASSFFCTWLVP